MSTKKAAAPKRRASAKAKPAATGARAQRVRASSAGAAAQAFKDVGTADTIAPPAEAGLGPNHSGVWRTIVRSRALKEWSEADLLSAAALCRGICRVFELEALVDAEGLTVAGAKGVRVMHPALAMINQIAAKNLALIRALRLDPRSLPGGRSDPTPSRDLERRTRELDAEHRPTPAQPPARSAPPARLIDWRTLGADDLRHITPAGLDLRPGSSTYNQIAFTRRPREVANV
jgi:hypothetical protein